MRSGLDNIKLISKSQFDQAKDLMGCVELKHIFFSSFSFESSMPRDGKIDGKIELSSSGKASAKIVSDSLEATFDFLIKGIVSTRPVMEVRARISAIYSVPEAHRFSNEQAEAFAESNGRLNVWPYWREFVQSATARAGFPPLTLPPFRVMPKASKASAKVTHK